MTPNLIKSAPVTSLTAAESLVAAVLTFLVSHGVIGSTHLGQATQILAPLVALVLPALFGAAKHALVTPTQKVEHILESTGLLNDADIARIEAILTDLIPPGLSTPLTITASGPLTNVASAPVGADFVPAPPQAGATIT